MTEPTAPPLAFKDRRLGLIIFGVLQILFGLQSILGTIFVVGLEFLSPKTTAMPMPQAGGLRC
jgi:hypothetical protein